MECFRKFVTVRQVPRHDPDLIEDDVDLGRFVIVAVMNLAAADGETVDLEREELLDLLRPGFLQTDLRILLAWRVDEIQLRPLEVNLAHERAVEERHPLHREIDPGRGEKRHRHIAARLHHLHRADL